MEKISVICPTCFITVHVFLGYWYFQSKISFLEFCWVWIQVKPWIKIPFVGFVISEITFYFYYMYSYRIAQS